MGQTRYHIIYATLLVLTLLCSGHVEAQQTEEAHLRVALRMIGHRLLLYLGDSTSRVLPITKEEEGYMIRFERELAFEPGTLTAVTKEVMNETFAAAGYIVEVRRCDTEEVVHSFEGNLITQQEVIPCKGRALPEACYVIYMVVRETQETSSPERTNDAISGYHWGLPLAGGVLLLGLLLYRRKTHSAIEENSEWIPIGNYYFDKKAMKLILNGESEVLSAKEADLLELLHTHKNETLEREHILHVVWGDEGDYVGRTLDVFVSKLRKKLEGDPAIQILNSRGVGYRLVVE